MIQEDIKKLNDAIYEINSVGGPLHIVLDDANLEDKDIIWCLENSIKEEEDIVLRVLCRELANILLGLTIKERIDYLGFDPEVYDIYNIER